MNAQRYIVIVYQPAPKRDHAASYTMNSGPEVKRITARSPDAAADQAKIQPGGHALVILEDDVLRFDRAAQAPLERKRVDGNPVDVVVGNAA